MINQRTIIILGSIGLDAASVDLDQDRRTIFKQRHPEEILLNSLAHLSPLQFTGWHSRLPNAHFCTELLGLGLVFPALRAETNLLDSFVDWSLIHFFLH